MTPADQNSFDTYTLPSLPRISLIKETELAEWCDRLIERIRPVQEGHARMLKALDGRGTVEDERDALEALQENFGDEDTIWYDLDSIPDELRTMCHETFRASVQTALRTRGRLDARNPGILWAPIYPAFVMHFVSKNLRAAQRTFYRNQSAENRGAWVFWLHLLERLDTLTD